MLEYNPYMIQAVQKGQMTSNNRQRYTDEYVNFINGVQCNDCVDFDTTLNIESQRLISEENNRNENRVRNQSYFNNNYYFKRYLLTF